MSLYAGPALYALFVWWFSTGVIIWLDLRPRTFRWAMGVGTALFAFCLWQLSAGSADTSVVGTYVAFTAAVLAWGWQEMAFFMGYVTGPRRAGPPDGVSEWQRFVCGVQACLWHELAIIATGAIIIASTWGAPNQTGTWTFCLLWAMRQSAKLNFFLGVLNLGEQFIPPQLAYLSGYLRRRSINLLFPISVTAGTVGIALLLNRLSEPLSDTAATGLTFLVTMLTLAVIEHWVLILPIPFARLWDWALALRKAGRATTATMETTHGL